MNQSDAIDLVTSAVKELGFERINPESLTALAAASAQPKGWKSKELADAYLTVMDGFRALFAPQRWHRNPVSIHEELEWTNADKHEYRKAARDLEREREKLSHALGTARVELRAMTAERDKLLGDLSEAEMRLEASRRIREAMSAERNTLYAALTACDTYLRDIRAENLDGSEPALGELLDANVTLCMQLNASAALRRQEGLSKA